MNNHSHLHLIETPTAKTGRWGRGKEGRRNQRQGLVVAAPSASLASPLTLIRLADSPLAAPNRLPVRSVATIASTPVLVVAPHPDDETLGCGGAIALLSALGFDVRVLVISDGTLSHPGSQKYPAPALRALREAETRSALSELGVSESAVTFLRLPDGSIPTLESPGIRSAVASCRTYLEKLAPQIVFLPWRCDPHPDHRATWKLIQTALVYLPLLPRVIEYPIWDWDPEQRELPNVERPNFERIAAWRLDINVVVALKQRAIAAYRSQTTRLIDDDPAGFCLTPEMLGHFSRPWEVYFEAIR